MAFELIALFGPTGIGKTSVAVELAKLLRSKGVESIAVSSDALQLYRGLETLTGVASASQQRELEHRLVSCVEPSESFSAGRYGELAHREIDSIIQAGKLPIVVGGTGLYLRASLTQLDLKPPVDPEVRLALKQRLEREGLAVLYQELQAQSPNFASSIEPTDTQRTLRGLELLQVGVDPSIQNDSQLWADDLRLPTLLVGLTLERELLYQAIERRVDQMVSDGAANEVKRVLERDPSDSVRKALGFRELLAGDVEGMKIKTRQYARRQLTWMRKLPNVQQIDLTEINHAAAAQLILERFNAA